MPRAAEPAAAGWHRALAFALCGQDLTTLPDHPMPDPAALAEELAAAGWDRVALHRHAEEARAAGAGWPHRVPAELLAGLSAAQFAAALRAVTLEWRLTPTERRVRHGGTDRPTAADQRLLRDLPPHFGKL